MTSRDPWTGLTHPPAPDDELWGLFHENSKVGRHYLGLPDAAVLARMRELSESLSYEQYRAVPLPSDRAPLSAPLGPVMRGRTSVRAFRPDTVALRQLSSLLHHAYGVTRPSAETGQVRSWRAAPSPGGLYPLELYVHTTLVDGLRAGLYHYSPARDELRHLREGDLAREIASCFVQGAIAYDAPMFVFLTAWFERVTFKYGDRGYRFALLEAGHVAQNLNLAAGALGLGALNLGGYFDHELDDLLGLDGVTASTVYALALGRPDTSERAAEPRGD
ncbi:MAG: SagB/ThcOx family dehydrogenase [Pseudonocardiales bacterium]|nr:SagB/ThcOx family dehydrogenase [Pseudonocardiales bacterium]MBV9031671.1 SagB/ThcOx family dehydrogenase [Pseudonocardiales bacterium]MBW0010210.1 SagB/ThcOx family dehydrogenase [Pseudonocardiales bacterium]